MKLHPVAVAAIVVALLLYSADLIFSKKQGIEETATTSHNLDTSSTTASNAVDRELSYFVDQSRDFDLYNDASTFRGGGTGGGRPPERTENGRGIRFGPGSSSQGGASHHGGYASEPFDFGDGEQVGPAGSSRQFGSSEGGGRPRPVSKGAFDARRGPESANFGAGRPPVSHRDNNQFDLGHDEDFRSGGVGPISNGAFDASARGSENFGLGRPPVHHRGDHNQFDFGPESENFDNHHLDFGQEDQFGSGGGDDVDFGRGPAGHEKFGFDGAHQRNAGPFDADHGNQFRSGPGSHEQFGYGGGTGHNDPLGGNLNPDLFFGPGDRFDHSRTGPFREHDGEFGPSGGSRQFDMRGDFGHPSHRSGGGGFPEPQYFERPHAGYDRGENFARGKGRRKSSKSGSYRGVEEHGFVKHGLRRPEPFDDPSYYRNGGKGKGKGKGSYGY